MSANLLYVTINPARFEALKAICNDENYALTICAPENVDDCSAYDLIFCDAFSDFKPNVTSIPFVAIYDLLNIDEVDAALNSASIDVLSYPFGVVETAARLRCLSRLHMLQSELLNRTKVSPVKPDKTSVLVIGCDLACASIKAALSGAFDVECTRDDMTGLLRAAQGNWSTVILALNENSREPAPIIKQLRMLDQTRTTPVLIHTEEADSRCMAALLAGANDMATANCLPRGLIKRVAGLALRKAVLDALRADAASITPLSDFDHATGLPGPTQLQRSMQVSLERLKAQGKPASLLLVAVDRLQDTPESEPVSDAVMLALTQVLRRSLRGFDYACRFSADCFAVLMPGTDAKSAGIVAARICSEIKSEKVRLHDGRKDGTTASIGLATMAASGGAASVAELIVTARDSLDKAQAIGAAQIVAQELKLAA